jgi:hypothetical protein
MPDLGLIVHSSLEGLVGGSFGLGIAFHHAIRAYEIDSKAWLLIASYVSVLAMVFYAQVADLGPLSALVRTSVVANSFNVGLAVSILLYRGYFHRLHRFPGPFLAKLSRFYAMRKAAKNLQGNIDVQRLHERYGDFVRVGKLRY